MLHAVLRAVWTVLAAVAVVGVVASCAAAPVATDPGDWVVVTFDGTDQEFDAGVMDALLETEVAADEALQSADAGWIDGNEIGNHQYDIYFAGYDREAMWRVLEPIFEEAPMAWTRVELRAGLEDPAPRVLAR